MNNEQKQDPIFCGSGVEKFDGNLVEISVCLSKIPQEHRFEYDGKWYAKLKVQKKKDGADEYDKTHSVSINTWKPEPQTETADDLGF